MDASWKVRGGVQVPGPVGDAARLLVAGDTHGNLGWIETLSKMAARHHCQGVLQLGDFGFWPDLRQLRNEGRATINDRWLDAVAATAARYNVWWRVIDGNHDAHPLARELYDADDNGVRPIRNGTLDWADRGAVWEWSGIRFGALGGGISIDRAWRSEGRDYWATEVITDNDVDTLTKHAGPAGVDVLVTHDAPQLPPGMVPLSDPILAADCQRSNEQIARAVDTVKPTLLLHGHYHRSYTHTITRPWGNYQTVGLSSDEEAADPYGGPWTILELPTLRTLERHQL